jgi:hypothetical protein
MPLLLLKEYFKRVRLSEEIYCSITQICVPLSRDYIEEEQKKISFYSNLLYFLCIFGKQSLNQKSLQIEDNR